MHLRMTRRQLLEEVSSHELTEYMAYCAIEPLPMERFDYWFAAVQAMLANINRDTKRQKRPYEINQFTLFTEQPEESEEAQLARYAEMFNIPDANVVERTEPA